jgi:hypothetical protein
MESPESWFANFGSRQFISGATTVQLKPGFAGVVKTNQYHISLTPDGDSKGFYVTNKMPSSRVVHEQQGGTSNLAFDYRVVAKRKDIPGERLQRIDELPTVELIKLPELPAMSPLTPPVPPPGHSG